MATRQKGLESLPKFSVIIPSRNRPRYLAEAVASVLAQTFADFELLVVNDGAGEISSVRDPRLKILNNYQHGAVAARNLGVATASGDFIAFLDDDDVWVRGDHLDVAAASLTSSCDFYFADGAMVFPDGSRKLFARDATAKSLERDNTILISAVCYKKSLHASLGLFDVTLPYYWDWDWYLRVVRSGAKFEWRKLAVVDIRIHAQNMSGHDNLALRRANLNLLQIKHNLLNVDLKSHIDFV